MSQFTSFVAVDSSARTAGSSGTTVTVPVPVPEGVRYDTTVQDGNRPVLVRPAVPGGGG
jgi:Ca-activated chloride channel family protein